MLNSTASSANTLFKKLTANLSKWSKLQYVPTVQDKNSNNASSRHSPSFQNIPSKYAQDSPEWVYDQPKHITKMRTYQWRIWSFCGKCGCNGKWVCTHTESTHQNSDFLQRKGVTQSESSQSSRGRLYDRPYADQDYSRSRFHRHGTSPSCSRTPPALGPHLLYMTEVAACHSETPLLLAHKPSCYCLMKLMP